MDNKLTHFDNSGNARMVDVGSKVPTERVAIAVSRIKVSEETLELIEKGQIGKGDVLGVARVAGIMASKQTSNLIPMCHPLMISSCNIDFDMNKEESYIGIKATVKIVDKTGVEMEALTAAMVTALTIYDMCKAVDKRMVIEGTHLLKKTGGKSGESVTDNCNLRCVYCMEEKDNIFLKKENKLTDDEIYRIVKESASLGIKKIRITGGEPLVRQGIVELIGRINSIPGIEEIYMTTNGILLYDKVEALAKNGLKGVNISLDSLKEERFKTLTRRGELSSVLKAIDKCLEYNLKVKINTVMVNDINKDEIIDFVDMTKNKAVDVRFIELMPIGIAVNYKGVTNEEILATIKEHYKEVIEVKRSKMGGPATYVKLNEAKGKIGFISAMIASVKIVIE